MDIIQKEIDQGTIVSVSGRLDAMTSIEAQKVLLGLLNKGKHNLIIDLTHAEFLSSAGLCALLIVAKRAKELKAFICLVNLNPQVHETLEITGFLSLLQTYTDLETALKAIKSAPVAVAKG